ncbi:cysteine desulfurase [Bacillus sp. ISL-47]|uniref:cysteine desulfurase family protein n=1 Tax=Bacillus sp. ISL-47 TaxID=2819130 RepID=UPI001BECFF52|nr:cysteine desulfurase family protein [Bacillus sp. ISL-47]MBT2686700.1 cysteine desulfurase [Bacillus sp. ISL-47]MBT2710420.1 cysteine desulfurase [Pseudomonas sp. ISL-84]
MEKIYLDYNASTPVADEVVDEMRPFLNDFYGNPSALHWAGRPVKEKLMIARNQVANLLSCSPDEIIFTSGGSEANNLALKGYYFKHQGKGAHIITSRIEHPAILNPLRFLERLGAEITMVDVDQYGMVSPQDIANAIREDTILITIMHANNEVGTIQPIDEIGEIARRYDIAFHTDASQSVGKVPLDVEKMNVDMLTIAGHKLYAPKGIGALYLRKGIEVEPLIHGAGHEFGLRAGTENTLLAVGLGKACELAQEYLKDTKLEELTNYFWNQLRDAFGSEVTLNGHEKRRLPNTLNVSFVNRMGQDILDAIPLLAASTGSACHSGKIELSPVLREMGVPENIGMGAIRFSLGRYTTKEEIDQVVIWLGRFLKDCCF